MAVRIESQAEPIPGYRLLERLGGGGFGEVWKCEAPGGLHKAIKFVYGDLESHDEEGARAEQEHRSLARIQNVRHPYILSLERYDIIEGQLIIVMELADRTLWDRFKECRTQGQAGIPRAELLGYMRETAEALDLMLSEYQLQHLDIKPQNLFLVHNHVKVADFGLVKVLEKQIASVTGGVTPVYAAPETFDGYVSRFSDQYSLAIVYQELLTGKRPFDGGTMRQLILQHLQAAPDLKSLPEIDRDSIGRALAKSPDGRFPTCKAFIDSLNQNDRAVETPVILGPRAVLDSLPPPAVPPFDPQQTQSGAGLPSPQNDRPRTSSSIALPPITLSGPGFETAPRLGEPSFSTLEFQPPGAENDNLSAGVSAIRRLAAAQGTVAPATIANSYRKPASELTGDGILSPALVVGLGFLGLCALKQLRQEVHEQFGDPDRLPHLRFLYLDTDPEAPELAARGAKETALQQGEVLLARLRRPSHYLKGRFGKESLEAILPSRMLYRITRQQTTAGVRALGRLALVDNYRAIIHRLESELRDCCQPEALQKAAELTGLGIRGALPRVYVVTSLSGGTGSGMFIDVAYLVRHLLRKLGADRAEIVGLLLAPPVDANPRQTPALANTYAALTELAHFGHPASGFQALYDGGETGGGPKHFAENGPAFQRALILPLTEQVKEPPPLEEGTDCLIGLTPHTRKVIAVAGHYLFADLASPLGRAAEQARKQHQAAQGSSGRDGRPDELNVQAMGMYRILWPRRQLLARTAVSLCRKLVQRWMTKDAKPLRVIVQDWVRKQWDELGLGQDKLIARLQQACENALQRSPEEVFTALVATVAPPAPPTAKKKDLATPPQLGAVVEALDQLEKILGIPEDCKQVQPGQPPLPPGFLEQALQDSTATTVSEYEQILAEVTVRLIETPDYRLAGAEETIRQFSQLVQQALENHEQLAKELVEKGTAAFKRLQVFLEKSGSNSPAGTSTWNTPFSRRVQAPPTVSAVDLGELLKTYSKTRLQGMILEHLHQLYVALRGLLSDQLREVDYCRARLSDLARVMEQPAQAAPFSNAPAAGRCLFPEGCASLEDAVKQLEESLTADHHRELDQRLQAMLKQQFRALVHVCTSSANLIKTVAPAMLHEAQDYLSERLGPANVAEMYLNQHEIREIRDGKTSFPLKEDLRSAFGKAVPAFKGPGHAEELCFYGIPLGQGEEELRQRILDALPDVKMLPLASSEEIIFYRERNRVALGELPQIGPTAEEAYQKMCAQDQFTPHSRADITDWLGVNLRQTQASVS